MSGMQLLIDALPCVALLNLIVTVAIIRSDGLGIGQKIAQTLIVWLVPMLGGVMIGMFMWTQRGNAPATAYRPIPHEHGGHIAEAINRPAPPEWPADDH